MRVIDFETWMAPKGLQAPRPVCLSTFDGESAEIFLCDEIGDRLERWLSDDDTLGGSFLPFDLTVAAAQWPHLLKPIFRKLHLGKIVDTHTRQALIDIAEGKLFRDRITGAPFGDAETGGRYKLEYLAKLHLGIDLSEEKRGPDSWRRRYAELDGVPLSQWPAEAVSYSLDDSIHEFNILRRQGESAHPNLAEEARTNQAAFALYLVSTWGMRTDAPRVEKLAAKVEEEHQRSRKKLLASGLVKVRTCIKKEGELEPSDLITSADLDTAPQDSEWLPAVRKALTAGKALRFAQDKAAVQARVAKAYNGNPPYSPASTKFPDGQIKTDRETLEESGDDLLVEVGGGSNNEKIRSTYIPVLRQGTEVPITPQFNVLVETGRTSCSRPNLQNIPRTGGVRECFVPRPGFVYCSVDYGALEICTLAQVLHWLNDGPTAMGDMLRADRDPHSVLGAQLLAIEYEEFLSRRKAKDKQASDFRQLSKAPNFGLPAGMGAPNLVAYARANYDAEFCVLSGEAEKCGIEKITSWNDRVIKPTCARCIDVAQRVKETWLETFPEMQQIYFPWINSCENAEGWGEIQVPPNGIIRGDVRFTQRANLPFQGLAARGAKAALFNVLEEAYTIESSPLFGSRGVVFVHDEIIAEMPISRAFEAGERMAEIMRKTMGEHCPDIPIKAEPAWMWRWLKGAECWRGKDGAILPWVADECPACAAIAPTTLTREVLEHDEIRDGKKTVAKCRGSQAEVRQLTANS